MKSPVLWLVSTKLIEAQWIRELLTSRGLVCEHFDNSKLDRIIPNSLVVFNHDVNYASYFARCEDAAAPFGAIHLSDEFLRDNCLFYHYPACKFVYRNYWNPAFVALPKVRTFGLGYKQGFWANYSGPPPLSVTGERRTNHWVFAGAVHSPDRIRPLQLFQKLQPHKIHVTRAFNSPDGLSVEEYRNWLLDAKFALCPMGHYNLDCFRLYEVMEAGAVPVTLSRTNHQPQTPSYWHRAFDRVPPFIHRETWEECFREVELLLADAAAYEERRLRVVDFWTQMKAAYKSSLLEDVRSLE